MIPAMLIRAAIVLGLLGMIALPPRVAAAADEVSRAKVKTPWVGTGTKRPIVRPPTKWLPPNPCRKGACRR